MNSSAFELCSGNSVVNIYWLSLRDIFTCTCHSASLVAIIHINTRTRKDKNPNPVTLLIHTVYINNPKFILTADQESSHQ